MRRGARSVLSGALVGAVAASVAFGPTIATAASAGADPIGSLQAQASQIASQIAADGHRLDLLSEQYYQAQAKDQALQNEVASAQASIAATRQQVEAARTGLRNAAIAGFIDGGTSNGLSEVIGSSADSLMLRQEYLRATTDSVATGISRLHVAEEQLTVRESSLRSAEASAHAALQAVANIRSQAMAQQASAEATLGQVKGHLAALVAQAQAAAAAAAERRPTNIQPPPPSSPVVGPSGGGTTSTPPSGSGAGMVAVRAAYSQLGVPYVWGGETPGIGFDCSGLTQWAWGRAGVSLPRTAQAQYDAIQHIPLSALQPGDLVFWDDGTSSVQHVGMYVGNGEVVHAPMTGETVRYTPIWNSGLVGAGRP